ncbi:thermonuclease family protein [Acaryochloris marina]|uniref:thermonuclease family protein n=1 Tax=Acaryochloris marina TaxID=155978 RepID=UPI001BB06B0E|nr:thermonuclease family protein [Acaryochloris marina]QUY45636.1 thermonuclease family protein [Acaryochloris marina S15]
MPNLRQLLSILLPPLLLGCSPPPSTTTNDINPVKTISYTVVSTGDGDTLKVQSQDGTSSKVRVGCIDAPESSQEYGPEAGQRLKVLLPSGATIELREIDIDQYGRTVAEIYSEGKSVGLQLVREGYSVVYHRYLDGCSDTADQYVAAEEEARSQRLNFWSQSDPVMPWDYRRGKR